MYFRYLAHPSLTNQMVDKDDLSISQILQYRKILSRNSMKKRVMFRWEGVNRLGEQRLVAS